MYLTLCFRSWQLQPARYAAQRSRVQGGGHNHPCPPPRQRAPASRINSSAPLKCAPATRVRTPSARVSSTAPSVSPPAPRNDASAAYIGAAVSRGCATRPRRPAQHPHTSDNRYCTLYSTHSDSAVEWSKTVIKHEIRRICNYTSGRHWWITIICAKKNGFRQPQIGSENLLQIFEIKWYKVCQNLRNLIEFNLYKVEDVKNSNSLNLFLFVTVNNKIFHEFIITYFMNWSCFRILFHVLRHQNLNFYDDNGIVLNSARYDFVQNVPSINWTYL